MAALAPQALSAPGGQCAQGDTLVELHMIADHGGLTNDDARAMVDEEVFTYRSAGMDVDAGYAVGMLCHHSGQHRNAQGVEHMGQAVNHNGKQAGIGEDDLISTGGRRVSVIGCLHVGLDHAPNLRDGPKELQANVLCFLLSRLRLLPPSLEDQHNLSV